jgi:hypothetical protein
MVGLLFMALLVLVAGSLLKSYFEVREEEDPITVVPVRMQAAFKDFLAAALSFKRDSQPKLYPSSGESGCFLFSTFN